MTTISGLLSKAVESAKQKDREKANSLLMEVEKRLPEYTGDRAGVRKIIKTIRDSYAIGAAPSEAAVMRDFGECLVSQPEEGVSLVTCCMNRTENLLKALPTWLRHDRIREIIIVDWSSERSVRDEIRDSGMLDDRIRMIRVEDEPRWILSYAYNLGFRCSGYTEILKVDADITIKPDFFKKNILQDGTFIAGNWEVAEKGQEHINGFFYIKREDILNIKGFNEYITTYGWDDDDLYSRLVNFGLKRVCVDVHSIYHIPHDDSKRLGQGNGGASAFEQLRADPLFNIRKNRYIAQVMPPWKSDRQFAPFDVLEDQGRYLRVRRQKTRMPHYVNRDLAQDAEYHAALELMSWRYGAHVYHMPKKAFVDMLHTKSMSEIDAALIHEYIPELDCDPANAAFEQNTVKKPMVQVSRPKIYIDGQHGLGNRLRAIASAACVADASDRELVIVWQPDEHAKCRLHDLFEYEGAVIEESFIKDAAEQGCRVYNYMEVEPGSRKDEEISLPENGDIYIRSAYVLNSPHSDWTRENRFLQSLQPVKSVRDLVASVRTPNDVSVHVRMAGGAEYEHLPYESAENWTREGHEEIAYWRQKSHYSRFLKRLDDLIRQKKVEKIFLAADNQEVYDVFADIYADRLAFLPRRVYDRSSEQMRYALADALLLGKSPLLLGSTWSSFSELAMRLSKQKLTVEMSGKDF